MTFVEAKKTIAGYNLANSFSGSVNIMCGEIDDSNQLYMETQLFIHNNLVQHMTLALYMCLSYHDTTTLHGNLTIFYLRPLMP